MENERKEIKLSSALTLSVLQTLEKKHNIRPKRDFNGGLILTQEELNLITSLELFNPKPGFSNELNQFFPNLKSLKIISPRSNILNGQAELNLITSLELLDPEPGFLNELNQFFPNLKSLKIDGPRPNILNGLHLLSGLQELSISSPGDTSYKDPKNIHSISDADMEEISRCTTLQKLSIVNQANVRYINVSKLENLQDLAISDNSNLKQIFGLEQLQKLWFLECYGNKRLHTVKNLDQVILQNKDLAELHLDVLLFPDAVNYDHISGQYNENSIAKIHEIGEVSWKESMLGNRAISINTFQMIQLHNKSCQILADNIPPTAQTRDIIVGIEQYLARNVTYDYDAAKNKSHTNGTEFNGVRIQNGPKLGANGAYNTLIKNISVCQGYTRGMQYLLKLKGIHSRAVSCIKGEDTLHMSSKLPEHQADFYELPDSDDYHSIICIDDYHSLYADPCWNAIYYQGNNTSMPWLLMTKEEIFQDHTLSFEERPVNNNYLKQPRNVLSASIRSNNLFRLANTRISSVHGTKSTIKGHVKGQIIQKDGKEV